MAKKLIVSINDDRHEAFIGAYIFYNKKDIEDFVEDLRNGFVDDDQQIRFYNKFNKIVAIY